MIVRRFLYLEPAHVSWVSGILETVLVALQEKLQLKPENDNLSK